MQDVVATVLLTAAGMLGCFQFIELLAGKQASSAWGQVTGTAGVTTFLIAVGFSFSRSGVWAAILLLVLSGLIYDTVARYGMSHRSIAACTWLGLVTLFFYIGVVCR